MSAAANPEPPLIRLRGVTKVYGEGALAFQALKGVDLDIARGDFVAIMGPSGSGKSTAMNTLGCLDRPTTGQYLFQGVPVESLGRDQRALLHAQVQARASYERAGYHIHGEPWMEAGIPHITMQRAL